MKIVSSQHHLTSPNSPVTNDAVMGALVAAYALLTEIARNTRQPDSLDIFPAGNEVAHQEGEQRKAEMAT